MRSGRRWCEDALKQDEGYAGAIETGSKALLSSHAVKRFFGGFYMYRIGLFRRLLQQLFLWRLRLEPPPLILLGLDTMVMDNDEAEKRHGAAPTQSTDTRPLPTPTPEHWLLGARGALLCTGSIERPQAVP